MSSSPIPILSGNTVHVTMGDPIIVEISSIGEQGIPGEGVPVGGATGQVLAKASDADYDTEWVANGGGAVDSVNGQTGVVVLDAADVGAVATVTGDGVGGTATDVVLSFPDLGDLPDVDTTGATQGDALVYDGAEWVAEGVVLDSEKGVANGVATLGADGRLPYGQQDMTLFESYTTANSLFYYFQRNFFRTGTNQTMIGATFAFSVPIEIPNQISASRLCVNIGVASGAASGGLVELALYTYHKNVTQSVTKLASVNVSCETTGIKEGILATPVTLQRGIYRVVAIWNGLGSTPSIASYQTASTGFRANLTNALSGLTNHGIVSGMTFPLAATISGFDEVSSLQQLAIGGTPQ
jgi:hypothetical protein